MNNKKAITRNDILPLAEYSIIRKERRRKILAAKRIRRIEIGTVAVCHFENYDSMWQQIHEMLYIERGGEEQIEDELSAYNPLIPNGQELVCTVMFEIDDPVRRKTFLSQLGGIEDTMYIELADEIVWGVAETDTDRTTADGKASAVQFIHFSFTQDQVSLFCTPGRQVLVGFKHQAYAHITVMSETTRESLSKDFIPAE